MRSGLLYIMAKEPLPGQVKTRLCPPLTAEQASQVAEAFAVDTIKKLVGLANLEVCLALSGAGDFDRPAGADPSVPDRLAGLAISLGIAVEPQGEGDLGARMGRLIAKGIERGLPTILVGTDSPDQPLSTIASALEALGRVDAAIAPARDGGYVLVGARRPIPALFEIDAPWGSERVFAATCEALRREDCTFEVLASWDDVDDAAALGRLATRLGDDREVAPVTARLLDEWRRGGVRF